MNKETIERAAWVHAESIPQTEERKQYSRDDFMAGAKWRINSVWHDIDKDLPDCGRRVVNEDWFDFEANSVLELKRILKKYPFKRWAYVDDLMPDTGKEAAQ